MHKIGFELEVDEGCITPSTGEVTLAIREALPKEFWADYREDTWGITTIYPLDSDGRPFGTGLMEQRWPTREMLKAQLAEQKKLVAALDNNLRADEERIANLERYNGNQSDTINVQANQIKAFRRKQDQLHEDYRKLDESYSELLEQRDALDLKKRTLTSRLDDSLIEWEKARKGRDTARRIIVKKEKIIKGYQGLCRQKNARITKLRERWGDDESLTYLENHAEAIKGEIDEVLAELDGIRTGR